MTHNRPKSPGFATFSQSHFKPGFGQKHAPTSAMQISAPAIANSAPPPAAPSTTGAAPAEAFHAVLHQTAKLTDKPAPSAKDARSHDGRTSGKSHPEKKPASSTSPSSATPPSPAPTQAQASPTPQTITFPEQLPTAPSTLPSEALSAATSAHSGDGAEAPGATARNASTPSLSAAPPSEASQTSATLPQPPNPNPAPESASPNFEFPASLAPSTGPRDTAADAATPVHPGQNTAKAAETSTASDPAENTSTEAIAAADPNNPTQLAATTPPPAPPPTALVPSALPDPTPSTPAAPAISSATKPGATSPATANRANLGPTGPKRDPKSPPTAKPNLGGDTSETDDANPNAANPQHSLIPAIHEIASTQAHNNSANPNLSAQPSLNSSNTPEPLHSSPDPSTSAAAALPRNPTPDPQLTPAINTAKLIQTITGSEMRVGMRTADFGNISIRTSLAREGLSAQISLDHNGLGQALSAHLPAMEAKLREEYGVRANVEVMSGNSSFSGNPGHSSQEGQPGRQTYSTLPSIRLGALPENSTPTIIPAALPSAVRLDIRI